MISIIEHAKSRPQKWFSVAGIISVITMILIVLPSLFPATFSFLHPLKIDTDPENMLSEKEEVRLFHHDMRKTFDLYDMVVVGVTQTGHEEGVFNPATLQNIYALTEFAKTIQWEQDGRKHGVIESEIIAPSMVDTITQEGLGVVRFQWLMESPPKTQEEARDVAVRAKNMPFLDNTLISDDGKSLALYIPLHYKKDSYRVATALREKIDSFSGEAEFYITGLPIAQDQFGIEMFKQMAISAPLAMILIFILMWLFFRNIYLITAPMIVALFSVIFTMGLLIISGNTVHIMSSMIPIFIMPIAVLDSVHILSDFFDRYPKIKNRLETLRHVMRDLSKPMLFTSITTAAGFGSLAFTPIPPVQVFGIFIGIGVLLAWFLTITLIPAYIMMLKPSALDNIQVQDAQHQKGLSRLLQPLGTGTFRYAKTIVMLTLVLGVGAYIGISKININDNPVKWFEETHDIRVADRVLNEAFAGTYMGYLVLEPTSIRQPILTPSLLDPFSEDVQSKLQSYVGQPLSSLEDVVLDFQDNSLTDEEWDAWDDVLFFIDEQQSSSQPFKNPDVLRYISQLQDYLLKTGLVGKSNGIPDIVKTVHRELYLGKDEAYRIPDSSSAVAQTYLTYESSHRPQDLWHFVTPDFTKTLLWIQLKSGDNQDMQAVVSAVSEFLESNPGPVALSGKWFGLNYINVVWQDKMVSGMLEAFLGSFVIVLVMMIALFRSFWWGLLSMIPLTITISFIYGVIGHIGKDYDMPVAVLSSLSLGLAVDYAIHFLARSRELQKEHGSWKETLPHVFDEPARAIARNVIVIGVGFTPLIAAPLVPYQTVGIFISSILFIAGLATLFLLPALIRLLSAILFRGRE